MSETKIKIGDIYGGKFLKAEDLQGQKHVVEIEKWEIVTHKDHKQQIALHFVDREKMLGLNLTNATTLAALANSEDPDEWVGAKIRLYTTKVPMEGKQVLAIRISEEFYEPPNAEAKAEVKKDKPPF
jgi:hypothetical protein